MISKLRSALKESRMGIKSLDVDRLWTRPHWKQFSRTLLKPQRPTFILPTRHIMKSPCRCGDAARVNETEWSGCGRFPRARWQVACVAYFVRIAESYQAAYSEAVRQVWG